MAATLTVRIDKPTDDALKQIARETGQTKPAVLRKAVEDYRRKAFLEAANAELLAARSTHEWQEELEELRAWDAALPDGLERE